MRIPSPTAAVRKHPIIAVLVAVAAGVFAAKKLAERA